ncbi:MAG: cell division protein SepF [Acidimicrobiia bacterium]|nr:cell division protein SepF [Acidimicrobiia bacterium]
MASLFSKAMLYLGLTEEDSDGDQDRSPRDLEEQMHPAPESPQGRRIEPPAMAARNTAIRPNFAGVGVVRSSRADVQADILVVEEFADAKILADRVRDRVPVVLDFRRVDSDLLRRVIDFSSGLIYALDGTMTRVGDGLVLVLPPGTDLSQFEKRRLASLGAYEIEH